MRGGEHEQVGLWSSSEPKKCKKGASAASFKDSVALNATSRVKSLFKMHGKAMLTSYS